MHELDTILEDFCWLPKSSGSSRLVFSNLDRGEHCVFHSLEGNYVTSGIGHRNVHLPIPLLCLGYGRVDNRFSLIERYRQEQLDDGIGDTFVSGVHL